MCVWGCKYIVYCVVKQHMTHEQNFDWSCHTLQMLNGPKMHEYTIEVNNKKEKREKESSPILICYLPLFGWFSLHSQAL